MNAGQLVALLARSLAGTDPPLTSGRKARYGREFKEALSGGTEPETLERSVARIAERWQEYPLSVEQAVRDVQRGEPSLGPPGVAYEAREAARRRRTEGYEHLFDLSEKQEVMLATIQQLGKEGLTTGEIVERILGPAELEADA